MKISILLTILLIIISIGEAFFQEGGVCLIAGKHIDDFASVKFNLVNEMYQRAVKLVIRGYYLLNTVSLTNTLKTTQTRLIQLQNLKFEG
ncbi:hypothetical protein [Falsiporphyromonas endometrii]|uniref:Uncharacterized protein n=1 Tax=Falsiporphyromonas endometrii TaxID=1387297 RepID=A0ABV9K7G0_9PORP